MLTGANKLNEMKETLKNDLMLLECDGNTAKLPKTQLNDYATLKTTLIKACGKYKRNAFEFPYPAKPVISALISGKVIDFKKEFQFFATPKELAESMANQILWDKSHFDILEPSAGHGALIDAVLNQNEAVSKRFDVIELSELNEAVLRDKYRSNGMQVMITQGDFLSIDFAKKYDLIIANPPFSKNQDIDHIRKMYSLLKDGGQLITIASKSWTFGSQKKQVDFKGWLEDIGADWFDLEQGSFKSSGTNVSGVLITVMK